MLALPLLLSICLPSLWSPPFPLHAQAPIPLFLTKVQLLLSLTPSLPLQSGTYGLMALFLFFLAKAALVYLPTALSVALSPLFLL